MEATTTPTGTSSEDLLTRISAISFRGPVVGVLLAGLTVYLGFNAGGFFPEAVAIAVVAVCVLMVLGVMLVSRPYEAFTPAFFVALGCLVGFAVVVLASALWSDSTGRALFEFDRALLYVLVFAFFGMLVPGKRRLEWGIRGLVLAAAVLCLSGWITRVAPNIWPISYDLHPERLSFPLTYWNALGLLAALGLIGSFHLGAAERESKAFRIGAAALAPLLASVLLLTFSRAAVALTPIGLIVYLLLARPPRLLPTLLATLPAMAVALVASYRAETVSSARFATPAGVSEGHHLALIVLLCALGAALLRWALLRLDARLIAWRAPAFERRTWVGATTGVVAALVIVAIAVGGPSWVSSRWHKFVNGNSVGHLSDPRERLTSAGNNGRIPQWRVAWDTFKEKPLLGNGAGTYELSWEKSRPEGFTVVDAHSLYLEQLGETGIVGFLLIVGAIVTIFVGLLRRLRGEDRHTYAAVIALGFVWAVHAGVDWDWEMPAVTLWFFALAGLALSTPVRLKARAGGEGLSTGPRRMIRLVAAVGVGILAITPAAIAVSQAKLSDALSSFDRAECRPAINSALSSLETLDVRAEPYELIGYCDAKYGQSRLAETAMLNAIDRDPHNWETHYGLAIVQAAAGTDPMPQLYIARSLNPLNETTRETIMAMKDRDARERERRARRARLPL